MSVSRLLILILFFFGARAGAAETPNVILIVADDMGFADMSSQGARFKTPNLDRMAAEGTRFTSFYVAQAVCTASRAALLTGCYPNRVGLQGALNHTSPNGIHPDEWLMPEMFKARGYATAGMGKWHLGTKAKFNPTKHGFDEWFGIPYSNDNSKYHPVLAAEMPALPLYDGEKVIETDPDQAKFTERFTARAVDFIGRNAARPFFLYLPHVMPHVPIFASEKFKSKSGAGLYGDVMMELDWSVGEILASLRKHNLDERTLVIFISDNGPFLSYGDHAGSAAPLREGKLTVYEGGVRVPCIARWPGRVPVRTSAEPFMAIDCLPTFVELIDGKAPEKKVDGRSIKPVLLGEGKVESSPATYFFYSGDELQAVRNGPWKLHFSHRYLTVMAEPGRNGKPSGWGKLAPKSITQSGVEGIASRHGYRVAEQELALYNLEVDPAEANNVAKDNSEIVQRLTALAEPIRKELGDSLTGVKATGARPVGIDNSTATTIAPLSDNLVYAKDGSGVYGYKDTPKLPWCEWLVHDPDRPAPPRIDPGPAGGPASVPSDAVVLFDGRDLSQWKATQWKLENGEIVAGAGSLATVSEFGDMQLHIEWMAPANWEGPWYNRGNNGVILMGLYEIQIFDSYNEKLYPDGQCASVYAQTPPLVNATRPPGQWQTFDIAFTAPRFEGDKQISPPRITMHHNGVLVHLNQEVYGETGHKVIPRHRNKKSAGPVIFAGHDCPVRFRNIWLRKL